MNVAPTREVLELLSPEHGALVFSALPALEPVDSDEGAVAWCTLTPALLGDRAALHSALAGELALPGYYGRNWDALLDVLADPFVLGARRAFVIALGDGPRAYTEAPATFEALVEIASVAERRWRELGEPSRVRLVIARPEP